MALFRRKFKHLRRFPGIPTGAIGGAVKEFKKTDISLLCPPNAFATCSPAGAIRRYHDAVVAELVDAQR